MYAVSISQNVIRDGNDISLQKEPGAGLIVSQLDALPPRMTTRNNYNDNFIDIAPLKTKFTKCST